MTVYRHVACAAAAIAAAAFCRAQDVPLDEVAVPGQEVLQPLDAAQPQAEAAPQAEQAAAQAAEQAAEPAEIEANVADPSLRALRISTRVFKLANVGAEEVAEKINATWSGDFGAVWKIARIASAFPESNTIMVTAPKRILDACERVIAEVDNEAPQVYIEARFVELGNTASHKLGIDWAMLGGMTGSATLGGGIRQTRLGSGVANYTRTVVGQSTTDAYSLSGDSGSDANVSYFNGTLNFGEMYLTLRALELSEDARVFSNPKIIVSSGKKATVDMTTKYPNVFISAKRTNSGQNINSLDMSMQMAAIPGEDKFMFAREAFFSWGISLDVTPRIGTNGLINVTIVPTISDHDQSYGSSGFVSAEDDGAATEATYSAKYPIIKVQRLITEFNMASGTTAVIGGLSRTVETQQDSGIPWLRSIPWIGPRLFGSKMRVNNRVRHGRSRRPQAHEQRRGPAQERRPRPPVRERPEA